MRRQARHAQVNGCEQVFLKFLAAKFRMNIVRRSRIPAARRGLGKRRESFEKAFDGARWVSRVTHVLSKATSVATKQGLKRKQKKFLTVLGV